MPTLPTIPADVLWWDSVRITIRCPFCSEVHNHGHASHSIMCKSQYRAIRTMYEPAIFQCPSCKCKHPWDEGLLPRLFTRVPHCVKFRDLPEYHFRFPVNQEFGVANFEIDKVGGRFCVVGWNDPTCNEPEYSQTRLLTSCRIADCPVFTESRPHELEDETCCSRTYDRFRSFCITNRVRSMTEMLGQLNQPESETDLLLGRDCKGRTHLMFAAVEGHLDVVKLLTQKIPDYEHLNAQDFAGRTALMEASLWARWPVVRHLIQMEADIGARDHVGRTASDYAENTPLNQKLRRECSSEYSRTAGQLHEDEVYRRVIVETLRSLRPVEPNLTHNSHRNDILAHFERVERNIVFVQPVAEWSLATEFKVVGIMIRGDMFPQISSHSGWAHQAHTTVSGNLTVLAGEEWTKKVLKLSKSIGYKLNTQPKYDHGIPGQFNASHAEKQLMAYFVEKHVFLPSEIKENEGWNLLSSIQPKCSLHGEILVSKLPCEDCEGFREVLNKRLGVDLNLRAV